MHYHAPVEDILFCLERMAGLDQVRAAESFSALNEGVAEALLEEAARTLESRVAPAHRKADRPGATFANGTVTTPDAFHEAYAALREGGYIGMRAREESGGLGLPQSLVTPINEMMGSSCVSLSLFPLLTQGAILAIESHGSESLKEVFLPRLISGEWSGTMNLTEPHAGSDVGAISTSAVADTDGTWRLTGQKQFISWGESDLAGNIVHLVLARATGAEAGTAGLSLFVVPKFLPRSDGTAGQRNGLKALTMERKLGLHGSPTVTMSYDGARGWLLGEKGAGMRCMFTMMNSARLGVGLQGVAIAECARQASSIYALERTQGSTGSSDSGIAGFPDVRRMLLTIHAQTVAARALCYDLAVAIDLADCAKDPQERQRFVLRQALLTPIAKAFGSDSGIECADLSLQIHGGAGYIEETGAAHLLRDARIASIYEGTNGIQALDLVERRLPMSDGAAVREFLAETLSTANELSNAGNHLADTGKSLVRACEAASEATEWMLACKDQRSRLAGSAPYLRLLAVARGGHYLGRGALTYGAGARWKNLARCYARRILPQCFGLLELACGGAEDLDEFATADLVGGQL